MRGGALERTASCAARRLLAELFLSAVNGLVAAESFDVTAVTVARDPRTARRVRGAGFCGFAALACTLAARALLCAARRASWNGRIFCSERQLQQKDNPRRPTQKPEKLDGPPALRYR